MQTASFWTYKNFDVFAAARNSSGIRWYCRTGSGLTLRAETKQGMRMLINEHLSKHSKPATDNQTTTPATPTIDIDKQEWTAQVFEEDSDTPGMEATGRTPQDALRGLLYKSCLFKIDSSFVSEAGDVLKELENGNCEDGKTFLCGDFSEDRWSIRFSITDKPLPLNPETDWKIYRNGRLYDSIDPTSRAVIQIAASLANEMPGDSWEVRDHNGDIQYERKPTRITRVALNEKQAARGEQKFRETMTPENRPVRDDVYTPFILGLELAGYKCVSNSSDCNILSNCDNCKKPYRTLIEDPSKQQFWACPFCNTLENK